MKSFKILSLSLLLAGFSLNHNMSAKGNHPAVKFNGYPAKTIVIKHPFADNMNTFFSSSQVYNFEIYKAGTAEELSKIIKSFLEDKGVESCTAGTVTGDFTAITLTLKANKDKAWFVAHFKKAGLNNIKVNTGEVMGVDKL